MKSSGLFRIGRDAEIRYLPEGKAVCNLSLAFNYGKKGQDGSRPTQWIDAVLFGDRATILAPMLLKGAQHVFHLSDAHIETYTTKDGAQGSKMSARVDDVELTDRRDAQQGQQNQAAPRPAPPQQRPAPKPGAIAGGGFDDMDSDIPW
jgi:single-strand DNA-binding protein